MSVTSERRIPGRRECANAIRALAMDAVQRANSGHPGMPMGMADIAEVLWRDFLRHNPANPHWPNRDRFVLSNGHGSMLLYALLHLTGYDLPMEEIRNFRQLHSRTPGHPEYGLTPGVETTTGPLGQGLANAVGMAIAERALAAQFNRDGLEVVDHHTWVFLGDGCLMEGISHEACSLAGTLGLGKLIAVWDDNGISIDGRVEGWFTDDTPARFEAYGWQVIRDVDGHDGEAVRRAMEAARDEHTRPTLVCCRTVIGFGSPGKQGSASSHGAALGEAEVAAARETLGWQHAPFEVPAGILDAWNARDRGARLEAEWRERMEAYRARHPELASELERRLQRRLPADIEGAFGSLLARVQGEAATVATRKASQNVIEALAPLLPEMLGGSADLTGSNNTDWSGSQAMTAERPDGNYLYFGVREFAMSAIVNGITLHGGFIPYCGTFLVFCEYARNAVRMAALMRLPSLFVYSHDSIGLGEDGPTHQAVEQLGSLRLTPNLSLWRPCDAVETVVAWRAAVLRSDGPTCLILSRQGLPHQARDDAAMADIARGGYVLEEPEGVPEAIVIATGSEVSLARAAAIELNRQGRRVRVVSMPSVDTFERQDASWRERVLPSGLRRRLVIEAGATGGWWRYAGCDGRVLGIDSFGESAPAADLFAHFGFTAERVRDEVLALLGT